MTYKTPVPGLVMKLTSHCNLKCTYCYWFKDPSVYLHPKKLTKDVERAFIQKLKTHLETYDLERFDVMLHGGEPLLFGKKRFIELFQGLHQTLGSLKHNVTFSVTTNGVLIDQEWCDLFRIYQVHPCISIDGNKAMHDKHRIDLKGRGTFDRTVRAIERLKHNDVETAIVSVIDPESDPLALLQFLVDEMGFTEFDFFIPDANYENKPISIAPFYTKLIDIWFDHYQHKGVKILFLDSMIRTSLGLVSNTQFIGLGREGSVILNPDGALEPSDTLRIGGHCQTETKVNILNDPLQAIFDDPTWLKIYDVSSQIPETCQQCRHLHACGGGHISQRWSPDKGYDNPSVYCDDYQKIFDHLKHRLKHAQHEACA